MAVARSDLELAVAEAEWTCARWRSVVLLAWRGHTTAAHARRVATFVDDTVRDLGTGDLACLVVIEPGAATPDADARPILSEVMRKTGPRMRGVAYVVPAQGFKGAAVRAVIAGLSLVAREPYLTRVFDSPDEAAQWLASRLHGRLLAAELASAVEAARHAHEPSR